VQISYKKLLLGMNAREKMSHPAGVVVTIIQSVVRLQNAPAASAEPFCETRSDKKRPRMMRGLSTVC
jgi:hypothetical protein